MVVRWARALQRCDAPDDSKLVLLRLRSVMAVRCVREVKSNDVTAGSIALLLRFKLVMHVFNDSARESIS